MSQSVPQKPKPLRSPGCLLITESPDEFEMRRKELCEEVQPKGVIERNYVDDIAYLTWDILRFRRWKADIINTALVDALAGLLTHLQPRPDEGEFLELVQMEQLLAHQRKAKALAHAWFDDEKAQTKVANLLQKYGLDVTALEAEAFRLRAEDLERCERLQAAAEIRRDKALRFVSKLRKKFGERLRKSSDRILQDEGAPLVPATERPD
jgi:hypothetical protein